MIKHSAAALGVAAIALLAQAPQAWAIPSTQARCDANVVSTTPAGGWQPFLAVPLTINVGATARLTVIHVTANANVDPGAEMRLGYSVDGGAVQEGVFGPANFANHQEYWETRATFALIRLPPGVHTVRPFWRVNGPVGKNGVIERRCATIEGFTS